MNVSHACITILAGYMCVVRSGTTQDQQFQGWIFEAVVNFLSFFCPFPPHTMAQQHQGRDTPLLNIEITLDGLDPNKTTDF